MESVAFIQWCLEHLNYWTITLLMTIESSFILSHRSDHPAGSIQSSVNDELNYYWLVYLPPSVQISAH